MEIMENLLTFATLVLTCIGILTWVYGATRLINKGFKNPWIQIRPIKKLICDYMIVDEGQHEDFDFKSQTENISEKGTISNDRRAKLRVDPFSDLDSERIKVFITERPDKVLLLKTKRKNPNVETDNKFHILNPVRIDDITGKSEKSAERLLDYRVGLIYQQIKSNEKYCKKNKEGYLPIMKGILQQSGMIINNWD